MSGKVNAGSAAALFASYASLFFISASALAIFVAMSPYGSATTCPEGVQFCGGVGIIVNPGGTGGSTGARCGSNITSCGTYPNCMDLTFVSYCVNGHTIETYCLNNQPQNRTRMTACTPTTNFVLRAKGHDDAAKQLTLTLFSPGTTNNPIFTSTFTDNSTISSPLPIADGKIDFDNSYLSISLAGLNVTKLSNAGTSNITIERLSSTVTISGAAVGKSYLVELPSSFSFTSLVLKVGYMDMTVGNQTALVLYRCANFNFATNSCSSGWELKQNVTVDTNAKTVSLPLTGFSVYSLAEQGASSSSTTTSTSSSTSTSTSTQSSNSNSNTNSNSNANYPTEQLTSVATMGNICNKNSDCCGGQTTGAYVCTPGGCSSCNPSGGNCYSCSSSDSPAPAASSATQPASSTSTSTQTNETTGGIFSLSFPALPAFSLTSFSTSISSSIGQNSSLTFAIGFFSGFVAAWLYKSRVDLPSFFNRFYNFPIRRRFTGRFAGRLSGRYGRIANVSSVSNASKANGRRNQNANARRMRSSGETRLILQ